MEGGDPRDPHSAGFPRMNPPRVSGMLRIVPADAWSDVARCPSRLDMTIVAHRCGTDLFPESTLAAARHSLALGADYLEIDIRFTRDGVPVISHDADLRRLFGDEEKICKLSAEGFHSRRHIARPDFGPAFLEEFFDAGAGTIRP